MSSVFCRIGFHKFTTEYLISDYPENNKKALFPMLIHVRFCKRCLLLQSRHQSNSLTGDMLSGWVSYDRWLEDIKHGKRKHEFVREYNMQEYEASLRQSSEWAKKLTPLGKEGK